MHTHLVLLLIVAHSATIKTQEFKIGGLFHQKNVGVESLEEIIFRIAIDLANDETEKDLQLSWEMEAIDEYDSIAVKAAVCSLLDKQVIAIFGPQLSESSPVVKSACDAKEIPNVQTRYDSNQYRGSCGINLYPHPKALAKAYGDVIKKWEWKSFLIIYEDNESLLRISNLLKSENNGDANVRIMQLPDTNNYINLFREIRRSKENNILLDCSIEKLPYVLMQAQQTGLMIENYNYIITCLDLHTIDLEPYKYSGVNITGFRIINPTKPYVSSVLESIRRNLPAGYNETEILVDAALTYDAINLYKKTLRQFKINANSNANTFTEELSSNSVPKCDHSASWKFGTSLVNMMKVTEMNGLTGLIKFDHEGYRTNIELQIIELQEKGIVEKGIWNSSETVRTLISQNNESSSSEIRDLANTTLVVIISLTKPYGMRKGSPNKLEGNDQYEGYAVDMVKELSLLSNFKYEFVVQEDGANGQLINCPNGTKACWDGMVGEVYHERAHLAVADITMSRERALYIDFSTPYMDLGIAILYIKPTTETPSLFSFLFPFSTDVWLYVVTAYVGVSLQFFIMGRLTPHEWINPYPCIKEPKELENQFTLSNSFWFTIGALMQQGSDVAPISPSTRIAAGVWWFFTLIMVSSYTANLAAFLTVENEVLKFKDAKELSRQVDIKYGAKRNGTTVNFFRDSKIPEYRNIYEFMMEHPECMTHDNEQGVEMVLKGKGKYAFFMESSAIEYEKEQHCELAQVGRLLDNKNYGIAMRKNSWYANEISKGVLILQEKGILSTLKRKWWKEKYSKNCQDAEKHDAQTLHLHNVGGVFLVLIAGVIIAFIVMLFEVYFHLKNVASQDNVPLKKKFLKEMKFILKCTTVKPAQKSGETSLLSRNGSRSRSEIADSRSMYGNNYAFRIEADQQETVTDI